MPEIDCRSEPGRYDLEKVYVPLILHARIGAVCRDTEYEPPVICTPEELMGD